MGTCVSFSDMVAQSTLHLGLSDLASPLKELLVRINLGEAAAAKQQRGNGGNPLGSIG